MFIRPSVKPGKSFEKLTMEPTGPNPPLSHSEILYSKGWRSFALLIPLCRLQLQSGTSIRTTTADLWNNNRIVRSVIFREQALLVLVGMCAFGELPCQINHFAAGDQIHSTSNSHWSIGPFVMTSSVKSFSPHKTPYAVCSEA